MLESYRQLLDRLRPDQNAWAEVAFAPTGEDEDWEDLHARSRYGALLCLQYDRRETDQDLIRYLCEQEVVAAEESPWSGLTHALTLGVFLLARFRDPADLPGLWRAKRANFDTWLGLDHRYLLVAGLDDWNRFHDQLSPEEQEAFHTLAAHLPASTPEKLAGWWASQERAFPDHEAGEDPMALVERALDLGDPAAGQEWLDRWEDQRELSEADLHTLRYYREQLGQPERALDCAHRLVEIHRNEPCLEVSSRREAAHLLITLERWAEAGTELEVARERLLQIPDALETGLSRSTVETMFELTTTTECPLDLRRRMLDLAGELLAAGVRPSLVLLEKAVAAAESLGEETLSGTYRRLCDEESVRIEAALKAATSSRDPHRTGT